VGDFISIADFGLLENELRLWIASVVSPTQGCSDGEFFALAVVAKAS